MKKQSTNLAERIIAREQLHNSLRAIENSRFEPAYSDKDGHERISEFNAALLTEAFFSQPLTDYAVGYRDPSDLDAELEFFAPEVPVTERFSYSLWENAEEWLSETTDDIRPIKGDFKEVEYTSSKVDAAVVNRGLQITLDMDQIRARPDFEEYYTQKLLRRLKRNELRRAIALLSAAATNNAKTWDTTAGKDPDQDVMTDLIAAADASGIKPNRVGFGDTAWAKRMLAHRAQASAGGFGSAALTADQIAGLYGVDSVLNSKSRYTTSATAKTQTLGNLVLMFNATSGMDTEDASNIKRFVANGSAEEGGGKYQVYSQRVSAKRWVIAVGYYSKLAITSTLGIRKITVS
jgi:hypothetical protein